ncbi:MAG: septum formation family protein [Acidimicrobiia bacterium]|nr:septum formation family protein [Acidimicrobiia bacterium]
MPTWLKVVLIVTGAIMVLAILGGVLLYRWANSLGVEAQASIPYPVFIGDCVVSNDLSGVITDCGEPHDYEVYHLFAWHGSDTYPDWSQALDAGWETSQNAFDEYVGIEWIDSIYDYEVIAPPQDRWNEGERTMNCVLYDIFEEVTVGSAMGSGR